MPELRNPEDSLGRDAVGIVAKPVWGMLGARVSSFRRDLYEITAGRAVEPGSSLCTSWFTCVRHDAVCGDDFNDSSRSSTCFTQGSWAANRLIDLQRVQRAMTLRSSSPTRFRARDCAAGFLTPVIEEGFRRFEGVASPAAELFSSYAFLGSRLMPFLTPAGRSGDGSQCRRAAAQDPGGRLVLAVCSLPFREQARFGSAGIRRPRRHESRGLVRAVRSRFVSCRSTMVGRSPARSSRPVSIAKATPR